MRKAAAPRWGLAAAAPSHAQDRATESVGQTWAPWMLWALTFVAITASSIGRPDATRLEAVGSVGIALGTLAVATIGALAVSRGTTPVPGWLLLGFSVLWSSGRYAYHLLELVESGRLAGGLDLARTLVAVGDVAYVLSLFGLLFLFVVVPDGSLPPGRWRTIAWMIVVLILAWVVQSVWLAGTVTDVEAWLGRSTLASLDGASPGPGLRALTLALTIPSLVMIPLVAAALMARLRAADGEQRQQLKWVLFGGMAVGVWFLLWVPSPTNDTWTVVQSLVPGLALTTMATGFGLALFKYRLWDVDLVVRRSLVYGTLWLVIVAVYAGVASALGLFAGARFPVEVAVLITVAATLVFQPARRRLESVADRWVFGRRHDPVETIHGFGASAAQNPQPTDVAAELAEVAGRALRLQWVEVEVDDSPQASAGERTESVPVGTVPIRWGNETWGTLKCQARPGDQLDADAVALLDTLVAQAALTISYTRLLARMVDAQDVERRRIERDIHDGAQQDLAALIGQLGLAKEKANGDAELDATFERLHQETRRILAGIRELAQGVYPSVLRDRGLLAAVEDRRAHLPVKLRVRVSPEMAGRRFDPSVEAAAYFTICEALNNVVKHSRSDSVDIALDATSKSLRIDVTDQGVGFDSKRTWGGTGIMGMSDRIRSVGGELKVESTEGQGTVVRAEIHLTRGRA